MAPLGYVGDGIGTVIGWFAFHWTTFWQIAILWSLMGISAQLSKLTKQPTPGSDNS
jgi:hypothetical protein